MSTEKTIAEIGYKVMPAKNGGFIVTAYVPSHPHGVEYAFSNARDLIAFLQEQHLPDPCGEVSRDACNRQVFNPADVAPIAPVCCHCYLPRG